MHNVLLYVFLSHARQRGTDIEIRGTGNGVIDAENSSSQGDKQSNWIRGRLHGHLQKVCTVLKQDVAWPERTGQSFWGLEEKLRRKQ